MAPPPAPEDAAPDVEVDEAAEVVVSLASARASVAVADASDAWAEITLASRSATFSDARVWPETDRLADRDINRADCSPRR